MGRGPAIRAASQLRKAPAELPGGAGREGGAVLAALCRLEAGVTSLDWDSKAART
jgi:hypothetical protein